MRGVCLLISIYFFLTGCDQNRVMEDFKNFDGTWHKDSTARFDFVIDDISKTYNLKAEFSSRFTYPYNNLYFNYKLLLEDSIIQEELREIILFDPKTGNPLGSGTGNLFDHEKMLQENFSFFTSGKYRIELDQFMRMDSLSDIERVGARVEFYSEN